MASNWRRNRDLDAELIAAVADCIASGITKMALRNAVADKVNVIAAQQCVLSSNIREMIQPSHRHFVRMRAVR